MSTLRDENSVLKEQIESLIIQNRVLRTKAHEEKIKLEYFGPFGRADPLRFLLYHARVDFDDVTVTQEQWGGIKNTEAAGEFNCLPIVTIDEKKLGQTNAVLRSLGTKYVCYDPSDHKKAFNIDVIVDLYTDLLNACVPILFFMQDKSREEKQDSFQKTIQPKQIPFFEFMEN